VAGPDGWPAVDNKYMEITMKSLLGFSLFFLLFLTFCVAAPASELPASKYTVRVIGHRGASGYAPENTMVSYKKAFEMGAEMVELDIYKSADGVLTIMHDSNAKRTTGVDLEIEKTTYAEIAKLDAGSSFGKEFAGEQVPTLEQVLAWAAGKIQVNIEIKGDGCEEGVVSLINKYEMKNSVIVSSFNHAYLKKIKELDPDIQTGALVGDIAGKEDLDKIIEECHPDAVNPRFTGVDKKIVKAAHDRGLQVNVYTVNDPISMRMLIKAGVDGIITNFPDVLLKLVQKTKPPKPE
jgi:glycerophosphoryl diester phosphodiesterase